MDMRLLLDNITRELEKYYESDFPTDDEDSHVNSAIKHKLGELIFAADGAKLNDVKQEALDLLAGSTGCMEDYEILLEITDDLILRGVLNDKSAKKLLDKAPVSRWR